MPPQISDEEVSDFGSGVESAPEPVKVQQEEKVKAEKKGKAKTEVEEPEPAEEESLMVESDKGEEEDEDDQVGEDEYVVEKITNHLVDKATGELKFEVKWEGYDKKSDRTWEPEENLETASKILNEYLASVGGKEQIFAQHEEKMAEEAAKKSKKRGRASSGLDTPTNGAKKGRKSKSHPLDTTPPASDKGFTPPSGNWEEVVEGIDACEGTDGKPIVYITWKTGQKSQHPLAQVYKRCPQKMLQFYEKHLVFKRNDPEE